MLPNSEKITFLTGNKTYIEKLPLLPVHRTFCDETICFLSEFSKQLMHDSRSRQYEDIISYAFWIRSASLHHIKETYYPQADQKLGRGVSFHIAPSNVPINFAVSFTSALLAGNTCVVRVSNKYYEQVNIIIDSLKNTFKNGFAAFENYLILIRYEHDDDITEYLSSICDIRIIWGGDRTIKMIRKAPLPPRAIEMTFADRYSLAFMEADAVLNGDIEKLTDDFYTDTYYMDQNACSSPRIIVWFGKNAETAQKRFWEVFCPKISSRYELQPVQTIDKLDRFCIAAANISGLHLLSKNDMLAVRIGTDTLTDDLMDYKLGGGYFFEYIANSLSIEELYPLFQKPCQTIAVYGIDRNELSQKIMDAGVRGVDRIVPVGKTMDLTFKWDGFDMIENMSRYLYNPLYR